ncbi:vWA domain-containing protein [Intestinibacter bartlettii]|uniref:vWA domain-containing protein n=1 Tax=Intestinibacter bartlettii TaxID=261299 RepID=UPI002EA07B3D|nr:vWA domain-containing protein [Intestinibacter bartlettii]
MGVKKFIKKSVAFVAAAAMALSMVVMPGGTVSAAEETQSDNLQLSKKIELQEDGNYKITLDAYATGKDTTTTTDKAVPLDIVLVLDQSGSMEYEFTTSSGTYTPMKSSGYSYSGLGNKEYYYKDGDNYYLVKRNIKKEESIFPWETIYYYYLYYEKNNERYYLSDSGTTTTMPNVTSPSDNIWTGVLYTKTGGTSTTRLEALKSAVTKFVDTVEKKAQGDPNVTGDEVDHRIAIVGFGSKSGYGNNTEILSVSGSNSGSVGVKYNGTGYTNATKNAFQDTTTSPGKTMLTKAINALAAEGATRTDLGMDMAKEILAQDAKKDEKGRKKLVIMFTDGEPTTGDQFEDAVANTTIANSKTMKASAKVYTIGIFDGADPAGTSSENNFMNYVSTNYPDANSMKEHGTADNTGYYKAASNAEELNSIFESIEESETTSGTSVTLNSESVLRDIISDNFELPKGAEANSIKVYTSDSDTVSADGKNITWKNKTNVTNLPVSINGNKVEVSGFDYSQNYVTASHPGKKLTVEILVNGLTSGKDMDSNDTTESKSGIYENTNATTAVKNFVSPKVTIPEYSYVLDYGKKVTLPNTDKDQSKAYTQTTKVNSTKAAPTIDLSVKKNYGTFALENNTLTYQPEKINWDGFDSIFSFGKKSDGKYEWSKTNVIPATSVYYEDDFGTDDNGDANVAIVWTGSWKDSKKDEDQSQTGISSKDNQQSSDNENYGWDDSYKDDTGYSNGSAHYSSQNFATATFRFTGTGVDVYSRTNEGVGKISTSLKKVTKNADGTETVKTIKYKSIDNLSVSGDYYQIPTLNYDDLDYGTYEVTIKVITVSAENRGTYYLDGIRVYNPLGKVDANSVAGKAYKEAGESNAQYIQVRKDLLDSSKVQAIDTAIQGSLFIDKSEEGITNIGTYKDYGPKNEVYLKSYIDKSDTTKNKIQGVAFNINGYNSDNNKVFIGLKSPTGKEVTVKVTSGEKTEEIKLNSAADLYYEITPTEQGNVVIENMSDNLLSITKVRITSKVLPTNSFALTSTPELMSYVNTFDALQEKQDTNKKDTEDTLDKGDVDINNPGDNDTNKDNSSQDNNEQTKPDNTWNKIMNSIKSWFRR